MASATSVSPELVKVIQEGNVEEIREHLSGVDVNSADEDGMTLLMHAAYKGRADTCKLLLARGADANADIHKHEYTALMFAALSGSTVVTRVLLEAGAKPNKTNNIGRDAAQLAAFIGHSAVGMAINFYFHRSALDHYSVPHGVETQPKIPPYVVPAMHELLNELNIHPVNILLTLQANGELLREAAKVRSLLGLLVEKEFKESCNELLSMKFHLTDCVLELATAKSSDGGGTVAIDTVIKKLLKGREEDGFMLALDMFLRQSIRSYPYHQSVLFSQLHRAVANVELGAMPSCLRQLHHILFSLQKYDEFSRCITCGVDTNIRKCTGCSKVFYCGRRCQSLHWPSHKKRCRKTKNDSAASGTS